MNNRKQTTKKNSDSQEPHTKRGKIETETDVAEME